MIEDASWADQGYGEFASASWIRFEGATNCEDTMCASYSIVAGNCQEPVVTVEGQGSGGNRLWSQQERVEIDDPGRPTTFAISFEEPDTVRVEVMHVQCK